MNDDKLSRYQLIATSSPMPPFIADLRQKIRNGIKTQTRRPLDPQPVGGVREDSLVPSGFSDMHGRELKPKYPNSTRYLREPLYRGDDGLAYYRDDRAIVTDGISGQPVPWRWKNDILTQIFMPREIARTFVMWEVYRLHELIAITTEDVRAEGIRNTVDYGPILYEDFKALWDGINSKRGFRFDDNPVVWAYKFSRIGGV